MTTIIVTGMHRSGTSMVAGILKLCGVYFGDNLLHPQQENPKGFFEDLEFLEINKEILACSGGSWFEPPNELKINQNIKEKIKIFLGKWEQYPLVGFKDPRCCLTLPVWADSIDNYSLNVLYCSRDPKEIAMSLEKRNGFTEDESVRLFTVYRDRFFKFYDENPEVKYAFTKYEHLLQDPINEIERVLDFFQFSGVSIPFGPIRAFVDKKLHRNRA